MMEWIFDPTITLGHIITVSGIVFTIIGWGFRMQLNMKVLTRKMDKIEEDLAGLSEAITKNHDRTA